MTRTEVGGFVVKDRFHVIVIFIGPAPDIGQLDLTLFINEDVLGSDVTKFDLFPFEILCSSDTCVQKIPDFALVKGFVKALPIVDFVCQQIRVVFVEDLHGMKKLP